MRHLLRLPEPLILTQRRIQWLDTLLASGKTRPDSSKYGNPAIKQQLNTISFNKCFYCESKLKDKPKEIDHHIEVSIDLTLSYIWSNLFLSCDNCNGKLNHLAIPITQALDPFLHTNQQIESNITFKDEIITAVGGSVLGLNTIQKYRLDSDLLDKRRITQLKYFYQFVDKIRIKQIEDNGRALNDEEIEAINHFTQIDQPYSLMFKVIINQIL